MTNISGNSDGSGNFGLETIDTAQSERVSSSRVIDLRRHPRVDTRFQAQMISEYGKIDGMVTNLSRSGLRFEAGSELSELLMRCRGDNASHSYGVVEFCFDVPASNTSDTRVVVQGSVVYMIEGEEGDILCGVEFGSYAEGERAIEDYLRVRGVGA